MKEKAQRCFKKEPILEASQIRLLEQSLFASGLDPMSLTLLAGQRIFEFFKRRYPLARSLVVFCGPGGNGADGLALASLAWQFKLDVSLFIIHFPSLKPHLVFDQLLKKCESQGLFSKTYEGEPLWQDVAVDAILGIGGSASTQNFSNVCIALKVFHKPILAIDLPSGLCPKYGTAAPDAIKATETLTFFALKPGLCLGTGIDLRGKIFVEPLVSSISPLSNAWILDGQTCPRPKSRKALSHKGDYGRLHLFGGLLGMGGALMLAGKAALRAGAGVVSLWLDPAYLPTCPVFAPELMANSLIEMKDPQLFQKIFEEADALLLGPGLGRNASARYFWDVFWIYYQQCEKSIPLVLDGDALFWLGVSPPDLKKQIPWILTPHAAEAARLLARPIEHVESFRWKIAQELQEKYGGVTVLKGPGTVVAFQDLRWLCPYGSPEMATAGMGDVLAGIIVGLLGQRYSLLESALRGVYLHAKAAEDAVLIYSDSICASDVVTCLATEKTR